MFRIGIAPERSDYDIQISSEQMAAKVMQRVRGLGIAVLDAVTTSKQYDFFRKDLVHDVAPHLSIWCVLQTDRLGRSVTVAAFPKGGPVNKEDEIGPVSSHFRDTDWRILPLRAQERP